MHIIKTTAPIPINFCTAIKTTKWPSWVVRKKINRQPIEGQNASMYQFRGDRTSPLPKYSDVSIFNMEAVRHLGFSSSKEVLENPEIQVKDSRLLKYQNISVTVWPIGTDLVPWQISRWSVKPLPRYRDFSSFTMAAIRNLGFSKVRKSPWKSKMAVFIF